ncbi:zinc finger protein basonuclin-1 isoform X3 [Sander lucioperca]|uniref:zinc finger protein basonuclin-1 isoform X3 n=1 Tax=Sander lucioperca TaxID=283035 RepID=UPI00125D4A15|nr:zinc finger protein basonuclin-1 isoform X3 [Sander lucioperca]
MSLAICCTLVNCNCDSFKSGKLKRRQCENCKHGWVAHALSKLKVHHMYQSSQVEIVHSNVVFDICSLMLYGTQAIPIRLKILLDRLFSVLKQEEVIQILNALDWTLQDYIRGYVLQDVAGKVLDRWAIMTFEEEIATLQQFLRFGETKSIVELMALQDKEGQAVLVPSTRTNSDIRTFIERNTPRTAANLSTSKVDKLSTNSMHHFENFVNSMAFMLPFQLLGSVPAPFLGSPTGAPPHHHYQQHQQPFHGSMEQQTQRRDDQGRDGLGRDNPLPLSHPPESSVLCSSSVSVTADLDQSGDKPMDSLSTTTKIEAEDFSTSDNYSDGPSTPCTPSMSSDVTQMSPEGKLRSLDRNGCGGGGVSGGGGGGCSLKKGRVFCNACEKTFYDKGTLKIHYNAVHLKIKHKCTIEGCNMVFSSLRSRNRHSANPNPRLHMPMNRNNRDKDLRGSLSGDESSQGEKRSEYGTPIPVCSAESHKSVPSYMVSHVDTGSKLHSSSFPSMGQSGILFPNLKTVQPVLPFYRSLVTPAELANTPGTLPSLPLLSSSVPVKPITAPDPCMTDPIPKKKSRKSSMPIKIEKEVIERDEEMDKGSSSEDEAPLQDRNKEECDGRRAEGHMCARQAREERDARGAFIGEEKQREGAKHLLDQSLDTEMTAREDKDDEQRQAETGFITSAPSPFQDRLMENHCDNNLLCQEPNGNEEREDREHANSLHAADKISELKWDEGEHRLTNGGALQLIDRQREGLGLDSCVDDYSDSGLSHLDPNADLPHHCEICSKTFKNPYSVKMHYQNVHLKEMHLCTVDGCNAAFPSRRSRDRHSANLNLHNKLLTKDSFSPANTLYLPSSNCRDRDSVGRDYYQDQRDRDLPHRDPTSQTSVIFRGHNRMGLVFPMSKMSTAPTSAETSPLGEMEGLGVGEGGGNGDDGAVLDLSTSSSAPLRGSGSARSSWDSDGAGSEEGEGIEEDEEALPMEDSDESCDGIGMGRPGGEELALGEERTLGCIGGGQGGLQGGGGGSPITCHVCQKVYSNKGTFRAHYKTVHLRLLHKCKVPGCETSFSSVRSRNRHSQNPNLHRNLAVSSGATIDQE